MSQPSSIWLLLVGDQGQDLRVAEVRSLFPRTLGSAASFNFSLLVKVQ